MLIYTSADLEFPNIVLLLTCKCGISLFPTYRIHFFLFFIHSFGAQWHEVYLHAEIYLVEKYAH